jgi:hypothetical protein
MRAASLASKIHMAHLPGREGWAMLFYPWPWSRAGDATDTFSRSGGMSQLVAVQGIEPRTLRI